MPIRPTAPLRPPAAHPWVLLLLLLLAAAARASDQSHAALTAVEPAVYATLRECLQNSGVEFVTPADKGYLAARQSEAEIMAIVECAAQHGVRVHSRCGGHGNQGETVATGDVTVDLNKHMRGVKLSPDKKTVVVKAGARIGQLLADLFEQSNGTRGFPGGQRPDVGVAGYSLGGGFGGATRFAGLASDNIIAIRAVVYRNFTAQVR
ncbi:hypothetical protein MNEG_9575 [Monoraphidium neglectum]|uniref:FAD-binding PCMH-type domain-containing protein n=1 Tax=Monoraphidium neglectum TaxID=145388 RepID=A0A0D2MVN3_9CHLO|nr:hypothetical protein MNEG_9575 [Monoraphidium neglectum]KIY98390.1 hypothetical protein MNEG_9575 [Monoraphidium neglectum]|eukprot:XP_013897410.1 hypothetical protein MNEG_9575 [Monoraphidium neglectum]